MSQLAKFVAVLYVFAAGLAVLGWSAGDAQIGTPYSDAVAKVGSPEEGLNGGAAFGMPGWSFRTSVWVWLQKGAVAVWGRDAFALRLPSVAAGAGTVAAVFGFVLFEVDDLWAGLVSTVLLLGSHLFFAVSRIGVAWIGWGFVVAVGMVVVRRWVVGRWVWFAMGGLGAWVLVRDFGVVGDFVRMDPVLVLAGVGALGWKRSRMAGVWLLAGLVGIVFSQSREAAKLVGILPGLAVAVGLAVPLAQSRFAVGIGGALFVGKLVMGTAVWGIPWDPEVVNASDTALVRYAALHRGNSLIVVDGDDNYFALCLGLADVRYVGADVSPGDYPEADLFLPAGMLLRDQGVHQTFPIRGERAFLLSRQVIHRTLPAP